MNGFGFEESRAVVGGMCVGGGGALQVDESVIQRTIVEC